MRRRQLKSGFRNSVDKREMSVPEKGDVRKSKRDVVSKLSMEERSCQNRPPLKEVENLRCFEDTNLKAKQIAVYTPRGRKK